MKLSIIMPAFNEESRIKQAIEEVQKVDFSRLGYSKELIVVNDGSTDNTARVLKGIRGIALISYPKNRGKGFALRKGFAAAKGDVIVVQDADLEYPPETLKKLLKEMA